MAAVPARQRSGRLWWIVAGAVGVVVVFAVVYLDVPLSHSFSFEMPPGATCGASFENASYVSGAQVSGSWQVVTASIPAQMEILTNGGAAEVSGFNTVVYEASGANGSFAFTGNGGAYEYKVLPATQEHVGCAVAPAVSVHGSWSATLYETWASAGPHAGLAAASRPLP